MNRVTQSVSVALVAALVLLTAAECKPQKTGSVDTDRNPADRVADPNNTRTAKIKAYIKDNKGIPGEVTVDVKDVRTREHESSNEILTVPGGVYNQTVTYTGGTVLEIHVEVKPVKGQSGAYCAIFDGDNVTSHGPITDGWRAICDLTTSQ